MLQLLSVIEEDPARLLQGLVGTTSISCLIGGGSLRLGGWVLHSLQQIMRNILIKGEEQPAAVAQVLFDCLEEFSPNADWLFGKRMRKT